MRRRRLVPALAVAALVAACGRCGGQPASSFPSPVAGPPPLATVDGEPIPAAVLERELAAARPGDAQADAGGGAMDPALRRRILDAIIDRALLAREARRRQVVAAPEELDRAVEGIRAEYPGARFDELLTEQGLTERTLRDRLADRLTVEKLLAQQVYAELRVGADEVERYYREHLTEFDEPAQVHALQIVVRSGEEARRIRDELRRKPDRFAEVARRVSVAPEAKAGGDLGWFGKDSGMPPVFERCLTSPVGKVSEVTPSPYGFHLFKVVERRGARRRALAEMRPALEERLLREKRARAREEFLSTLRGRARIQVDEAALRGAPRASP